MTEPVFPDLTWNDDPEPTLKAETAKFRNERTGEIVILRLLWRNTARIDSFYYDRDGNLALDVLIRIDG